MGLGLYLARAHLRALGGTIELESRPGLGTTVLVRFPLTEPLRPGRAA
jgi:signal transduction histidine kinase